MKYRALTFRYKEIMLS